MSRILPAAAALLLSTSFPADAAPPAPPPARVGDGTGVAWGIVEGLTTEIGPRLDGSDREAAAREWAKDRLTRLGFSKVRVEPFSIRGFVRGDDRASLTAPVPQPLAITALGNSAPTAAEGTEAPLVYFASLDALKAAPDGSLVGKIAFIDHAMRANQDGSGYGPYGSVRRQGPAIASAKGAIAAVIRSAGTDSHRNPHAGGTNFGQVRAIPAGAVSNPDADLIARLVARGKPLSLHLTLTSYPQDGMPSGNVIADLPGSDPKLPMVLLACHLDSWDLGTGAIDDASGCGIITEAALAAHRAGNRRTIRVLWAGSEELGGFGGNAYAKAHADERHALAMESDFGADRVWAVRINLADTHPGLAAIIHAALNPMGIVPQKGETEGGTDVGAIIAAQNLAVIDLVQDGTRYFEYHHTPDDTLDKVDPALLAQNVEAWTRVLTVVANERGDLALSK
jgi:carboxypeptidase Q